MLKKKANKKEVPAVERGPRPSDWKLWQVWDITIYDWGDDRQRPRAVISNGFDFWSIDIFATVKENAASICHPVIRRAIEKWERDTQARNLVSEELGKLAESHLKGLCKALLEGVKLRTPAVRTNKVMRSKDWLRQGECRYLRVAWEFVAEDATKAVKKRHGSDSPQLLALMKKRLLQEVEKDVQDYLAEREGRVEGSYRSLVVHHMDWVIQYLDSEQGGAFLGRRKSWEATKNIYLAWRLKLANPEQLRSYRRDEKNKDWTDFPFHEVGRVYDFPFPNPAEELPLVFLEEEA